jgi:hypothetical protein
MARTRRRAPRRSRAIWWWIGGGTIILAGIVWLATHPPAAGEVGIPVTTLIGKEAPVLAFPDAAGRLYRVPERGRPTVLIFHMGVH